MGPKPWRFKSDGKAQRKVLEAGTGMCDWQGASMLEKKWEIILRQSLLVK